MTVQTPPETKVLLCQMLNKKGEYEFRFSILRDKKERVFVKETSETVFVEKVTSRLSSVNIEHFQKIQNVSRFSLTNGAIVAGDIDMKKVPESTFQEVRKLLNDVVARTEGQLELV